LPIRFAEPVTSGGAIGTIAGDLLVAGLSA
jgi:hypothetical protein